MPKIKMETLLLSEMQKNPDRIHRTSRLSAVAQRASRRPKNIGPALSALIAKGAIGRARWGAYYLTKSALPLR